MREIKFRAWDLDDEMTHQVSSVSFKRGTWWCAYAYGNMYEYEMVIKNAVLMQFTGLKDKNGKEIYEGDILVIGSKTSPNYEVSFSNGKYVVTAKSKNGSFQFELARGLEFMEIVGNIYENPGILK